MGLMNIIHVLLSVIITVQATFQISVVPPSFFIVETQSTDLIVATIGQATTSTTASSLNCRIGRTTVTTSGGQTSTSTFGGSPFVVGTTDTSSNFGFVDNTIVFNVDSPFKLDAARVSRYELFPACTDPTDAANTQTNNASVIVHVFSNAKPSFRRPFDTATVNVALNSSAVVGARVYNATANIINDQATDVLAFSVRSIEPNVDYFTLNTASGILTNKVDLRTATQSPIELTIDVTDGFNSADRSLVLTVTLINMNQRPDIVGLPVTINRDENTQTLSIVDLSVNDEGVPTSLIPVCTVQPTGGNEVFDLVTRPISLKSRGNQFGSTFLDFETTPRYTVSCTVSDGFLQSQNEVLTFNVNNVNEAPVFSENLVNCIMDESQAGVSACNLGFSIRDPEGNRFITRLFQDENSNRFALTSNSNNNNQNNNFFTDDDRLTFNVDYDVDQGRMPERVTLFVNAVDEFGAISTATVSVVIRDVNDNVPEFNIINTAVDVTYQTSTGLLGSIQATDDDAGTNGEIDYRLVQVVPPNAINFVSVLGNGDIQYIRQYPDSLAGSSVYLSVEAKDRGTPTRSSTGTVVITLEATTTTSTTTTTTTTTTTIPTTFIPTTTPEPGFFDKPENVAIFSILMILLLLAFLIGLYFLFRWCITGSCCGGGTGQGGICDNCCRPPPPRRVQPSPMGYEDFDMPPVTASDYKGDFWNTGDYYVHGRPY
ncbi:hypothetical protein SNE40_006060 [Patella caerulea]|uniref:Cadherin domain-containing protein n=1 Tax=Patella caerulea TaxID=87958 RepID=A0AAN8K0A3_PATCE